MIAVGVRNWPRRNLVLSAMFVVLSVVAGGHALMSLRLGTLSLMGPGFFPVMLCALLGLLAIGVGFLPEDSDAAVVFAPLRATILVLGCPLVFAFAVEPFGLVIALFLTVFMSCFASRVTTLVQALVLSVVFSAFCVLVFSYMLKLTIPLWGEVFTG